MTELRWAHDNQQVFGHAGNSCEPPKRHRPRGPPPQLTNKECNKRAMWWRAPHHGLQGTNAPDVNWEPLAKRPPKRNPLNHPQSQGRRGWEASLSSRLWSRAGTNVRAREHTPITTASARTCARPQAMLLLRPRPRSRHTRMLDCKQKHPSTSARDLRRRQHPCGKHKTVAAGAAGTVLAVGLARSFNSTSCESSAVMVGTKAPIRRQTHVQRRTLRRNNPWRSPSGPNMTSEPFPIDTVADKVRQASRRSRPAQRVKKLPLDNTIRPSA